MKQFLLGAVVGAILLGGGYFILGAFGGDLFGVTSRAPDVDMSVKSITTVATSTNGSQGVPSYWTQGGVDYASVQSTLVATSGVPCTIPNPFGTAPALVLNFFFDATANGIASAQNLDVSTSSTAYASSSPAFVKNYSVGTGAFRFAWTTGASTTTIPGLLGYGSFSNNGVSPFLLGASERLNTRISTGTPGTFTAYYAGTCSATFMKS